MARSARDKVERLAIEALKREWEREGYGVNPDADLAVAQERALIRLVNSAEARRARMYAIAEEVRELREQVLATELATEERPKEEAGNG